jgi:hypothetical protein
MLNVQENIVTHRAIVTKELSKHIPRKRILNNRGYPLLGNGCVFCVVRTEAV